MKGNIKIICACILGFVLICGAFYGIYHFKRWWNYTWGYEAKVTETSDDRAKMNICNYVDVSSLNAKGQEMCKDSAK